MKRMLLAFTVSFLLFTACDNKPQYTITGKVINGVDGQKVYLRKLGENGPDKIATDSAVLSKGAFEMKGTVTEPDFYFIMVDGGRMPTLAFMENAPLNVSIDINDGIKNTVTGSPLNDLYEQYKAGASGLQASMLEISNKVKGIQESGASLSEVQMDGLRKEYMDIKDQLQTYQKKFMNDTPNTLVTSYVLSMAMGEMAVEDVEAIYSKFDDQLKRTRIASEIGKELSSLKKTAVGQPFIDLKLTSPAGEVIAISDFAGKGKYVLLDFWASWCGPCRQENPNIVKLYNKYKGNDFEILGISLDSEAEKWAKGIADDKITWPQMSDLKAWQSVAVETYDIKGIPHTILLDREGNIIAKNLRGEALGAKLAELLAKN